MSREALQAALLDAYAAMDAMETQLATLEHQLGVKNSDLLLGSRSSCTQPLQPLPPPPLPLYTSASPSLPLTTLPSGCIDLPRPVARSSSMPAQLTPTPPEEAATMFAPILGSATSSVSTTTKPTVAMHAPKPPPAIAFRSQASVSRGAALSGGFQPYAPVCQSQGCKRPAQAMAVERPGMVGCALPAEVASWRDAGQDGPSVKRIRLALC